MTFSIGLTFREFKRGLTILTTKPEIIQQSGVAAFIRKNQVEGLRILAADKKEALKGDTELGMDFQSFMMAQTMLQPDQIARSMNLQMLVQSAGINAPVLDFGGGGDF